MAAKKTTATTTAAAQVSISFQNSKMGPIHSVSLPPIVTCPNWRLCVNQKGEQICYALKSYKLFPSTKSAYDRNLEILNNDRDDYFQQVKMDATFQRYFRWHVSGDIIDMDYLDRMVKLARELKHTEFLAFTKNYKDVNEYFQTHKKPRNLHLILSLPFTGATIDNPHNLPTAAVILKGQEPDDNWKVCGGKCSECACRGVGCWQLKNGETIAFAEH